VERSWSEEDDKALLELRARGESAESIGKHLNRTHQAVSTRVMNLKRKGVLVPSKNKKSLPAIDRKVVRTYVRRKDKEQEPLTVKRPLVVFVGETEEVVRAVRGLFS